MIVPWLNSATLDTSASFIPFNRSLTARRRRSLSASTDRVLPSVRSMPHSTHLEENLQQFMAGSIGACTLVPGLAERINAGLYLTPRMSHEECREAIEG